MEQTKRRIEVGVAGVTHEGRQETLADLYHAQDQRISLYVRLERESANTHDSNAIKVLAGPGVINEAFHIGYIPKALAAKLAPRMDAGESVTAMAVRILKIRDPRKLGYGARVDVEIADKEAI